jgi:hypothetical protein
MTHDQTLRGLTGESKRLKERGTAAKWAASIKIPHSPGVVVWQRSSTIYPPPGNRVFFRETMHAEDGLSRPIENFAARRKS